MPHIFDALEKKVERIIENEIYPTFLQSQIFIKFIQTKEDGAAAETVNETSAPSAQLYSGGSSGYIAKHLINRYDGLSCSGTDAAPSNRTSVDLISPLLSAPNLQTLHEDSELKLNAESYSTKLRTDRNKTMLTRENLLATQERRLGLRPPG